MTHYFKDKMSLKDGDLYSVGWGECPSALVTPVKAIIVGSGAL